MGPNVKKFNLILSKNNRVPPRHMTEHWLKFQNGLSWHSWVIVWKQLKYNQMGQFGDAGMIKS